MRRWFTSLVGVCLAGLIVLTGQSSAAGDLDGSKLSPAMAQLVSQGGYGDFPIQAWVPNYRTGDVYYLAKLKALGGAAVSDLSAAGATVRFRYPSIRWVGLVSSLDVVANVSRLPNVTRLEIDRFQTVLAASATPVTGVADQSSRGTHDVGADTLWGNGVTGKGVTIGVADSGIDSLHPDLDDQDWLKWGAPGAPPKITSFVDCSTVVPLAEGACTPTAGRDDNGHGTHVSGIAAGSAEGGLPGQNGKLPGMAPEASLAGA
jgi:subtilisin family serine protease